MDWKIVPTILDTPQAGAASCHGRGMRFDVVIKEVQGTEKLNILFARRLSYTLIQT